MDNGYHNGNARAHSLSFVLVVLFIVVMGLGILTGAITP